MLNFLDVVLCQEADVYAIHFKWVITRSVLLTIPRNPLIPQDWTIPSQVFHSATTLSSIWNGISTSLSILSLASLRMVTDFIISHQKDHHCLLMMKFRLWNGFSESTLSLRKPHSRNSLWNCRLKLFQLNGCILQGRFIFNFSNWSYHQSDDLSLPGVSDALP